MVTPKQGDIVFISFSPSQGHEQKGKRPALVLSKNTYNKKSGLFVCVPITSISKGYPFEILIKTKKVKGVILADHIRTLDYTERNWEYFDKAPKSTVTKTKKIISILLS